MVSTQATRSSAAGFTLMELVCAFAVLSILVSVSFLGTANKFGQVRRSYQETLALQADSGRLEQLQADPKPLQTGISDFPLPPTARNILDRGIATQTVKQLDTGLYEVEATVSWWPSAAAAPVTITLKTLVVRE